MIFVEIKKSNPVFIGFFYTTAVDKMRLYTVLILQKVIINFAILKLKLKVI